MKNYLRTAALSALILLAPPVLAANNQPEEIQVPKKLRKMLKSFEPSAVVYLPEDDSFVISSDDTDEEDTAMLFAMSRDGEVAKEPIYFDGLETMTDIESLSLDGGYLYALSSQSKNKNGKVLDERNIFARGQLEGHELRNTEWIELRSELLKAFRLSEQPALQALRPRFADLMEIEASFVREGNLVVALKDPQPRGGTGLVISLGDVNEIFQNEKIDPASIEVLHEIRFGNGNKISDMFPAWNRLVIATTREEGGGSLWSYSQSGTLTEIRSFENEVPEGIAPFSPEEMMVVFDQGEENGLFLTERY
jgi:hypothetical protein